MYLRQEKHYLSAYTTWRYFPENYWGIGNRTSASQVEQYEARRLEANLQHLFKLWPAQKLFVGPRYFLQWMYALKPQPGGLLDTAQVVGAQGGFASGLGIQVLWDHRNSNLTPRTGHLVQFSALGFGPVWGSQYRFATLELDLRKYYTWPLKLWGKSRPLTLALQGRGVFTPNGQQAPFRLLALLGSSREMRGYYTGRYRDHHMVSGQAELRFPLFWRLAGTVWAGIGDVTRNFQDLTPQHLKTTLGMGGRFIFDRRKDIAFRADLGFGTQGNWGFYLGIGEVF
jgi:outer membrane protein assembly factor BamA